MSQNSRQTELTKTAMQSTGGYELVFSALLVGFLGYLLDLWLGTGPYLVIVFAIAGFLGASASLYYRFKFEMANLNEERS